MVGSWFAVDENNVNLVVVVDNDRWFYRYYTKPYCRVGAYAIGLFCGMIVFSYRHFKAKGEIFDIVAYKVGYWLTEYRAIRYTGFLLGLFFINFCIFIQYTAYEDVDNNFKAWSRTEQAWFMSLDRIFVCTGLLFILLPACLGRFTMIIDFCGASFWTPLARLTFSCYLIHMVILHAFYANTQVAVWWDDWAVYKDWVLIAVISWVAAVPVCLMAESSTMALEKMLLRKPPPPKKSDEKEEVNRSFASKL